MFHRMSSYSSSLACHFKSRKVKEVPFEVYTQKYLFEHRHYYLYTIQVMYFFI
jgi:hypothetical protein